VQVADSTGRPLRTTETHVNLEAEGLNRDQVRLDENGVALFDQVELGRVFTITTGSRLLISKSVRGPTSAGEEVRATLALEVTTPLLIGRAVSEQGAPLANGSFSLRLRSRSSESDQGVDTDAAGRFEIALHASNAGTEFETALLLARADGGFSGESAQLALPAPMPGGTTDLGEVVLATPPPGPRWENRRVRSDSAELGTQPVDRAAPGHRTRWRESRPLGPGRRSDPAPAG
jgi:hypothetical protein